MSGEGHGFKRIEDEILRPGEKVYRRVDNAFKRCGRVKSKND
jgi:hypothetical protein